jgi:hypothetical protein
LYRVASSPTKRSAPHARRAGRRTHAPQTLRSLVTRSVIVVFSSSMRTVEQEKIAVIGLG